MAASIKGLICDLDNTLVGPTTIPANVLRPVIDAVVAANTGRDAIDPAVLTRALAECWRRPFDAVARDYRLPEELIAAWARASGALPLEVRLAPYPDVGVLRELEIRRFLVTTGHREFQESKIAALDIGSMFDAIFIDAIDDPQHRGKEAIFRQIMQDNGLRAEELVVLGDSAESEIAAGNRLGIATVQILRDGIERSPDARYHVTDLHQLPRILALLS